MNSPRNNCILLDSPRNDYIWLYTDWSTKEYLRMSNFSENILSGFNFFTRDVKDGDSEVGRKVIAILREWWQQSWKKDKTRRYKKSHHSQLSYLFSS